MMMPPRVQVWWHYSVLGYFLLLITTRPSSGVSWIHRHTVVNDIPELTNNRRLYTAGASTIVNHDSSDWFLPAETQRDQTKKNADQIKTTNQPNIIFILADDLGYADVGYHNDEIKTPCIDKLAKRGVTFENYYSQQICAPSRAVLLTGKYVSRHQLSHNISPRDAVCLPHEHHLLPQELKKHGYSTHLVGKWHMGRSSWDCLPEKRGFDSFLGIHGGGAAYVDHTQRYNGEQRGYALYNGSQVALHFRGTYAPDIYMARADELITQHNSTDSKPLFLLLATQLTHGPNYDIPVKYLKGHAHFKEFQRMLHSAQASILDRVVDSVFKSLKRNNMWRNSVIMFTSDNGGCYRFGGRNTPLRGWKGDFFEGGIRVPAFMVSPLLPKIARGQVYTGLMGMADWYATIIKGILQKQVSHLRLDSVNMWNNIIDGNSKSTRKQYLFSIGSECFPNKVDNRTAYRWHDWKYIDKGSGEERLFLFNITADPTENFNLAQSKPKMVGIIQRKIRRNFCKAAIRPINPNEVKESSPVHNNGIYKPWL